MTPHDHMVYALTSAFYEAMRAHQGDYHMGSVDSDWVLELQHAAFDCAENFHWDHQSDEAFMRWCSRPPPWRS